MPRKIKVTKGELDEDALTGVKIWEQRRKPGRPRAFKSPDEMWNRAVEYFEWVESSPLYETKVVKVGFEYELVDVPLRRIMNLYGLCGYLGVHSEYFHEFAAMNRQRKDPQSAQYSQVIKRIRDVIRQQKYEGANVGTFSERMVSRELELQEKLQIDIMSNGETVNMAPVVIPYDLIENIRKNREDDEQE